MAVPILILTLHYPLAAQGREGARLKAQQEARDAAWKKRDSASSGRKEPIADTKPRTNAVATKPEPRASKDQPTSTLPQKNEVAKTPQLVFEDELKKSRDASALARISAEAARNFKSTRTCSKKNEPLCTKEEKYSNSDRYEGQWSGLAPLGLGVYYYGSSRDRYEGNFQSGKFDHYGVYYYASGDRYEGMWSSGERAGYGVYFYADGNRHEGFWKNGKVENAGSLFDPSNRVIESGYYSNGNLVKSFAKGPQQATQIAGSITDGDYPREAIDKFEYGESTAVFTVSIEGYPTNCVASGATRLLDLATCKLITERFRFLPARDADGKAVVEYKTQKVTWRRALPSPAPSGSAKRGALIRGIAIPASGNKIEDAYIYALRLFLLGLFPEAQAKLKEFVNENPKNERASNAQHLLGLAYFQDSKPALASVAFYENYTKNPRGERASESLYYLGVALTRLKKLPDACKVYDEFNDVYGSSASADLKSRVVQGRLEAGCSSL